MTQCGGLERAQPPKSPRTRTRLGAARRIVGDQTMITERRIQAELRNVEVLAGWRRDRGASLVLRGCHSGRGVILGGRASGTRPKRAFLVAWQAGQNRDAE